MGAVFGKISVETPRYEVIKTTTEYEIRKYSPSVMAEVTYAPSQLRGNKDGGFMILANYIGALGQPQNKKPEKIAPENPCEKIAMTAPVITKSSDGIEEKVEEKMVTMQFVLPSKYIKAEEVPVPIDERVAIREEGERKYGVVRFSGRATDEVVEERAGKLRKSLERDGYTVLGQFLLARYNDPRTLLFFRTNEVMFLV